MPECFIPLLFDECTDPILASRLREMGYDAVHVGEIGRKSIADLDQIAFATAQGRAIATYNAGEFQEFHQRLMKAGREHGGMILSEDYKQRIGPYLRDLTYTLDTMAGWYGGGTEWIRNQCVYIRKAPNG